MATEIWPVDEAEPYDGRPASDMHTRWYPTQTRGGVLGGAPAWAGWANGSLSWNNRIRQYGKYDIRIKAWPHPILSFHLLLWPQAEHWPPEIDIAESFHSNRRQISAFLHGRGKQEFVTQCDLAHPTMFSVDWRPEKIDFLCNGVVYGSTDWDIPHEPHRLAIQVETHSSTQGFTFDKTRVVTQNLGPPKPHQWVPVVEVMEVSYTPLEDL